MPSARQIEVDEPSDEQPVDLYSLIREIHGSYIHSLGSLHGRGTVLFAEGEPARGVFILRTGRATVSISSSEGRIVMLRTAQAGDVLGLSSVLRNGAYDATVKTLEPCRTDFISRVELVALMQQSQAGAQVIVKLLSQELTELTDRAKSLLLPQTASGRLAKLLLAWSNGHGNGKGNGNGYGSDTSHTARLDKIFTHEEIAQMICSSRETVTRLLATLSRKQVITVMPDSILIRDRMALEKLV